MSRPIGVLILVALLSPVASPASAQEPAPAHWRWATDQPARLQNAVDRVTDTTFTFVEMAPGWHVTMGPGGVLYDPRYFAGGEYTVESRIFHFPNSANSEYGLIAGGTALDGPDARYVAFVVRGDGRAAVWESKGGQRRMLVDWKRADAVIPSDGKGVVANQLKLSVSRDEAVFRANGLDLAVVPLEALPLSGQFGFRIGAGVNVHAATLTTTLRLAPVPAGR